MSVRSIEAEVSIKSGVSAECTIGREVVVEVHDDINLESLSVIENGQYRPAQGVDGWDRVTVEVPERQPVTESLSVTENGLYEPTEGIDGYDRVSVSVPERVPVTESLTATTNGVYEPDSGVDGYDRVTVAVPERQLEIESLMVTTNGTYTSTNDGYNPVTVNVPERQPITESLSVTENGTYTPPSGVDGFDRVTVDVPTGITPSGSQTFTENGTYDVTSLAQAVVNVQASGGGVHTEEGYVELADVNVGNSPALTIPVDLTSAQGFVLNLYAVETGEVSDGVVTKYDHIEVPTKTGTSATWIFNYMMKYPLNPVPEVYRDATNLATISQANNVTYAYTRRDWNGGQIGLVSSPTIASNGLSVQTGNGTRFFCVAGAYVKFKYEIKWW